MKKVIILSVRPEHAYNILTGKKTLELRKRVPKGYKGWVYCYVTKGKPIIYGYETLQTNPFISGKEYTLNGTIPFRFWFDEYSFMERFNDDFVVDGAYDYNQLFQDGVHPSKMCLTPNKLEQYGKGKDLYAWHIKQLDIFYEPMRLSDFIVGLNYLGDIIPPTYKKLTKAPQSYQYVWVKEEMK